MDAAAPAAIVRVRRFTPSITLLLVLFAAGAGIALRVFVILSVLGSTNSDEAVLGLMARHALHGEFTTFLWGTPYGGPQEAWLAAPIFAVFGSSVAALRAVPMALDVLGVLLIWRVGRRTIGERPAVIAAALCWIWPPETMMLAIKEIGFYASNTFYCALILLLVLRAYERPNAVRVGTLGLVLGLAVWETTQIVPLVVPAVLWLVWRRPAVVRQAWVALPAAVVGALPFLVWTFAHHLQSLMMGSTLQSTYWWRLRTYASPVLPMALGLRLPEQQRWQVPYGIGALVFVVAVVLFLVGAYVSRRRPVSLLYTVCLVYPLVMAISPRSYGTIDPHYVSSLMPVFALVVAQLARNAVSAALVLLAGAALSFGWVHDSYEKLHHGHPINSSLPRSVDPLIATLDRLDIDRVYTTYWIAYRLDFESRERIIAVENKFDRLTVRNGVVEPGPDLFVRYAPYERTLRASKRHAFVFLQEFQPPRSYVAQLLAHGYTPHDVQTFVVYAPPR
jgi:4-amino-4-deoxy-L-arabinose transferase-like glycosyltransferase